VTLEKGGNKTVQARAIRINELKPHVKIDEALRAVEEVELLMGEAETIFH